MDPSLGPDYRAGHGRPPHHGRDSPVTVDPPRGREAHRPGPKVSWQDPTSREVTLPFLARLFSEKTQGIVIASLSSAVRFMLKP
ncbi:hypothetical protein DPMN_035538 [Dreissena polymorpha]|uniref:Uncharacterized protein n=1 Tax=Dreissena polymorpha TaxID=45954 RepID=A0A9D4RM20_DREPO|nr:hypothetical protein DPMN_035538 [Dreissena polymorpha]